MGELGTWLVRAREARGLTVEDAERDTRISRRYLQALESENFEVIPAPVYARGFLRSYSQYLGLDPAEMLSLFPGDDDAPAPVIGGPRGNQSGNVGVATPPGQQKPTMKTPLSGHSAARPQWNKTNRAGAKEPPMPKRPAARQPQEPLRAPASSHGEYEIGGAMPAPAPAPAAREPMIGVDIGVPVPARNLNNDPAAQRRNLTVIGIAVAVIFGVVALAIIISRAGAGSNPPTATPTSQASIGQTSGTTPPGAAGSTTPTSGIAVRPGIVPAVEGLNIVQARLAIAEAGYKIREITADGCPGTKGTVTDQAPDAGSERAAGAQVIVSVCSGP